MENRQIRILLRGYLLRGGSIRCKYNQCCRHKHVTGFFEEFMMSVSLDYKAG